MYRILINAYAVCPGMGSEPGMGWNWITNLAKFCEVYVITESEYQDKNLNAIIFNSENNSVNQCGLTKEQCQNIKFYFVSAGQNEEDSEKIRKMCWNQGNWAFYPRYAQWQEKVLDTARKIISENKIDIMHQLNMAGFREPGMLYKINDERRKKGLPTIPIIWGPMAGYGSIPFRFMLPGGIKFTAFYLLKNTLNLLQLKHHSRVKKMIGCSNKLIAATPEMAQGIRNYHKTDVELINETGCISEFRKNNHLFNDRNRFKILWVGRFIYTKQLELALQTISRLSNIIGLEFHIVGKGFDKEKTNHMKYFAKEQGVESVCIWHGQITNDEVQELMRNSDIFFFTSIFEATSTVILEAIQNQLPIVCFDRCGFGPIVDNNIGIKIPCKNPKQAIRDFTKAINYLNKNRDVLTNMSQNCIEKQQSLTWDKKIKRIIELYESVLNEK